MFSTHFNDVESEKTKKNYWIMLKGSKVSPKFVKNRLGGYRKGRRKVREQVKSQ